jgi:hypothetical protein
MWRPDVAQRGGPSTPFQLAARPPIEPPILETPMWRQAGDHLGFYGFLAVANAHLMGKVQFGVLDLPDWRWRHAYDAGAHPIEEADRALEGTNALKHMHVPEYSNILEDRRAPSGPPHDSQGH